MRGRGRLHDIAAGTGGDDQSDCKAKQSAHRSRVTEPTHFRAIRIRTRATYTRGMPIPPTRAVALGVIAGIVGGLFGVGGGIIVVPGLVLWLGFTQHRASGTSVATIIASAGAALVPFALDGSVDWSAAIAITLGAIVGASLGARVLHRIPARNLTRAFSVLLFVAAVRMILA